MTSKDHAETQCKKELSLEDCNALLQFPFHKYSPAVRIKKEVCTDESSSSTDSSALKIANPCVTTIKEEIEIENDSTVVPPDRNNTLETCYAFTQVFQRRVCEALEEVRQAVQVNEEAQAYIQEQYFEKGPGRAPKKLVNSKPISLFAAPYFRDERGRVPPDNIDTVEKEKICPVNAYLSPPKPWLSQESKKLIDGVAASVLSEALKPFKLKRNHLKAKLLDSNLTDSEEVKTKSELEKLEKDFQRIRSTPFQELYETVKEKIDWMTISATNLEGSRGAEDCENMWNNYLSFEINKGPFTPKEDKRLKKLAEEFNARDWDKIATLLNTKRTAIQCFERYQIHLNENFHRTYWTPEEDELLLKLIEDLRVGNNIPWSKVACYLEGRTRQQCINRYERSVCTEIKKQGWTKEEDAMLIACVKKFKNKWCKMKPYLPNRSTYGARERYCNTLLHTLKVGNWSKEEDNLLIALVNKYGYGKWGKISSHLPGRTDNKCFFRAQRLALHTKNNLIDKLKERDLNDINRLCKKMKAVAPSHVLKNQTEKLHNIQRTAFETLLQVLKKVDPETEYDTNIETFDLSSAPEALLHKVFQELQNMQACNQEPNSPSDLPKEQSKPRAVPKYNPRFKYREIPSSTDEDEEEEDYDDVDDNDDDFNDDDNESETLESCNIKEELSPEEKAWTNDVLQRIFEIAETINPLPQTKGLISYSKKDTLERKLYLNCLERELHVLNRPPIEEEQTLNIEELRNFRRSVGFAVCSFLQPFSNSRVQVLCPNIHTLSAMEVMEATRSRTQKMANFVNRSNLYIDYLFGKTSDIPKCLKCSEETKELPTEDSSLIDFIKNKLKDEYFVPDETLQKALAGENDFCDNTEDCVCAHLKSSKNEVSLLRERFVSLFFWPFVCSVVEMNSTQCENLLKKDPEVPFIKLCDEVPVKSVSVKRKRKSKSSQQKLKKPKAKKVVNKSYGIKSPPKKKNSQIDDYFSK